jgi:uncharacterized Zn finger protein
MSLQRPSPEPMQMSVACPECGHEMTIAAVTPTMFDRPGEDIVYRCRNCGERQTRTVETPWST